MEKRDKEIRALEEACDKVLRLCQNYSYLWNEGYIKETLPLFGGFIAQDETFSINIEKVEKIKSADYLFDTDYGFVFNGRNFGYFQCRGLIGIEAAKEMMGFGVNSKNLLKVFYDSLEKPLGKYLAKQEIQRLKLANPAS